MTEPFQDGHQKALLTSDFETVQHETVVKVQKYLSNTQEEIYSEKII